MERTNPSQVSVAEIWSTLSQYRWRIAACVASFVGLAACVAALTPWTWRAGMTVWLVPQTMESNQQGEFGYDADRRLSVQLENFRQVAMSDEVLRAILKRVPTGAPPGLVTADQAIQSLRKHIGIRAPKGGEFGKSEIFLVSITDEDPGRALAVAEAFRDESQKRYQHLYYQKSETLTRQAAEATNGARTSLSGAQRELRRLELKAGRDLHDLRVLVGRQSADLLLKKALLNVQGERQKVEGEVRERQKRLEAVRQAVAKLTDSGLTAVPTHLFAKDDFLSPARRRVSELTARLGTLESRFTGEYPEVQAVRRELADARKRFRQALSGFMESLGADLAARAERLAYLSKQEREHMERLERLERMRTEYAMASATVERSLERVQATGRRLAEAQEIEARSRQARLLIFVDPPKVEDQPVGPKRRNHILAGLALGLLAGVGVAMISRHSGTAVGSVPMDPASELPPDREGMCGVDDRSSSTWTW